MRITVTIDDDVARDVKAFQRRAQLTFKDAVELLRRRGLMAVEPPAPDPPFVVETFNGGFAPDVDPNKLNQLV